MYKAASDEINEIGDLDDIDSTNTTTPGGMKNTYCYENYPQIYPNRRGN